ARARLPLAHRDVCAPVRGGVGPQPLGLASPPPDRFAVAGVVGVGPDEEVQPVHPRLEPRSEWPPPPITGRSAVPSARGGSPQVAGARNDAGSTASATTTGSRADQARCSRVTTSA